MAVKLPSFSINAARDKCTWGAMESLRVVCALADMLGLRNKLGLDFKYISGLLPLCHSTPKRGPNHFCLPFWRAKNRS